jgi:hypothetical protein
MANLVTYVKGDPKTNTLLDCEQSGGGEVGAGAERQLRRCHRCHHHSRGAKPWYPPLRAVPVRPPLNAAHPLNRPCRSTPTPLRANLTPGPFCHRVLLTLETKGVHYDLGYIDFNDKPKW